MTFLAFPDRHLRGVAAGPRLSSAPGNSHSAHSPPSRPAPPRHRRPHSPRRARHIRRLLDHPGGHFAHTLEPAA